jgi:hypothetical protein
VTGRTLRLAGRRDERLELTVAIPADVLENGHTLIMTDPNALLALKHAWHGAIAASDRLRELAPAIEQLGDAAPSATDLETYHTATLAQANAAQALRGVVERLRELTQQVSQN